MLNIQFDLPDRTVREELKEIVENMYPAPKDETGSPLYYSPTIFCLFQHNTIKTDCEYFQSHDAGDTRELDSDFSSYGELKDIYYFHINDQAPIVEITDEIELVVTQGTNESYETPFLHLEINTIVSGFAPRDSYEYYMLPQDGLTFHELADLQHFEAAIHFVITLLKRLQPFITDEMIESVSLAFDKTERNNLIEDYEDYPAENGYPAGTHIKKVGTSLSSIITLMEVFAHPHFIPAIVTLLSEQKKEYELKILYLIQTIKGYLRNSKPLAVDLYKELKID